MQFGKGKLMEVFRSRALGVGFDDVQGYLHLQCFDKPLPGEFRESLLMALALAEAHHIKRWLLDFRKVDYLNEEEEIWLHRFLFPKIMMSLGAGNFFALVLPDQCYQALLKEAGKFGLQSYNSFIIINAFSEADKAQDWLNTNILGRAS